MEELAQCRTSLELLMENVNDLKGIVQTIQKLKASRSHHGERNSLLEQKVAGLLAVRESLEIVRRDVVMQMDENSTTILSLQRDSRTLMNCSQTRDLELHQLRRMYRDAAMLQKQNEQLRECLPKLHEKVTETSAYLGDVEKTAHKVDYKMKRLQSSEEQMQHKMFDLNRDVEELRRDNEKQTHTCDSLQEQLEEARVENDRLVERHHQVDLGMQREKALSEKQEYQLKQLQRELYQECVTNERLQDKVQSLMKDDDQMKRELLQETKELVLLQDCLDGKEEELEASAVALKKKTDEFDHYRNTIDSLKLKIINNRINTADSFSRVPPTSRSHRSRNRLSIFRADCASTGLGELAFQRTSKCAVQRVEDWCVCNAEKKAPRYCS